ncbi:MAG: peptidase M24 family protein [Deltaproteobacteria bacterium HGW-Deltaproteobacteria-18]|jgi:Xaa-Pro aminopeptidase|nr:MAG: peptidase M24 family protein [Deltaproteobacteria bacterium HGW-Deltaproteobacteria-18]
MTHSRRLQDLKNLMQGQDIDALLVVHPANRFYLSGFELHDGQCNESSGCLLIRLNGPDWLLTDARFTEEARRHWAGEHVHVYGAPRVEKIAEFVKSLGISELWVETHAMCAGMYLELGGMLSLHQAPRLVEELRTVKDGEELARLRASCALNHRVYEALRPLLVPGVTEREVAWMLEKEFREGGAESLSFAPIVGFGPNGALPHATPGEARLEAQTPVLIDMGGRLDGYCSDQTRTWWIGDKPTEEFRRTLALVQEAQSLAIARVAPGVSTDELHATAREFFARHGVAEHFTHSLGHGIGLETHEAPGVGPVRPTVLRPGMVITVEPGLYYPEWGGVRWEHMVVVTGDGHEVL